MINTKYFLMLILAIVLFSCQTKPKKLPILGEKDTKIILKNGVEITDTVYHTIPNFAFINQNNDTVTNANYLGKKIYIADFFFTSCPTICPKMKTQMSRIYKQFAGNESVGLLSHTIDPRHDTVPVLNDYAKKLGLNTNQWTFVTGPKEKIYSIAMKGYMATAKEDSTADGGFVHSGAFILVDKLQHVRGIYDGTKANEVDELIADIELLLKEK